MEMILIIGALIVGIAIGYAIFGRSNSTKGSFGTGGSGSNTSDKPNRSDK